MFLKQGDRGQMVRALQVALAATPAGANIGKPDGMFGPKTFAAVRHWQAANRPGPADGRADPAMLAALDVAIFGFDLSKWQSTVDAAKVDAAFIWHRATQGPHYVDKRFAERRAAFRAAGVPFGAYAFAVPHEGDPIPQAQHLLRTATPQPGDLVPWLDLENCVSGMTPAAVNRWAIAWLEHVEAAIGRAPVLYSGPGFLAAHCSPIDPALARFPFAIARYRGAGAVDPGPVKPWDQWSIWQYGTAADVAGVPGNVDHDVMFGGRATLARLTIPRSA